MTLPSGTSPISIEEVRVAFGAPYRNPNPNMGELYANINLYVAPGTVGYPSRSPYNGTTARRIPSSGAISLDDFHGAGIQTGSGVTSGSAMVVNLPNSALWLGFRLVGGGGGGGGSDAGSTGGFGGGGTYIEGIALIPESSNYKQIVVWPGDGGTAGASNIHSTGYGAGASGIALAGTQGAYLNTAGGRGDNAYWHGNSGAGGGGGAGSLLTIYNPDLGGYAILAGGGGGGGGGGAGVNGGYVWTPNANQGAGMNQGWLTNINGLYVGPGEVGYGPNRAEDHTDQLPWYDTSDGGGGGGGGGLAGLGGRHPNVLSSYKGVDTYARVYDRDGGGGGGGYIVTNQTGYTPFTWLYNSGAVASGIFPYSWPNYSASSGTGGATGGGYAVNGTGGAISWYWSTQAPVPNVNTFMGNVPSLG